MVDCLAAYGLGTPTTIFNCSNLGTIESEERAATTSQLPDFKAFPNPTTGQLTVQIPTAIASEYHLSIHDMLGHIVHQTILDQGTTSVAVNLADDEDGVYYVELQSKGQRLIKKIVKQGLE